MPLTGQRLPRPQTGNVGHFHLRRHFFWPLHTHGLGSRQVFSKWHLTATQAKAFSPLGKTLPGAQKAHVGLREKENDIFLFFLLSFLPPGERRGFTEGPFGSSSRCFLGYSQVKDPLHQQRPSQKHLAHPSFGGPSSERILRKTGRKKTLTKPLFSRAQRVSAR